MEQFINYVVIFLILNSPFIIRRVYVRHKAHRLIADWAQQNGYIILEQQYHRLHSGPFWTTSSQLVYHVLVDDHGRQRSCWLRVGNWLWGMIKEELAVNWDKNNGAVKVKKDCRAT